MNIQQKEFSTINLNDPFFDSLKQDYVEFASWFSRKAGEKAKAFVLESQTGLEAFLYLKREEGPVDDVNPALPAAPRLKIGTFKVNPHGTRLGERFIKKILDYCVKYKFQEAYVTVFAKHKYLVDLLTRYGFEKIGLKSTPNGDELVLIKSFVDFQDHILKDFPLFKVSEVSKFLLAIYPEFHTRLFPDSILNNEHFDIIQDVSHTNSIHKVYICSMNVSMLKPKDLVVIYRTGDGKGAAYYRSVVTSICVVEEVRRKDSFTGVEDFLSYAQTYSVFSEEELRDQYAKNTVFVIKMTYNAAFSSRINRKILLEEVGLDEGARWGFLKLTDEQFVHILNRGGIDESLTID